MISSAAGKISVQPRVLSNADKFLARSMKGIVCKIKDGEEIQKSYPAASYLGHLAASGSISAAVTPTA